MNEANISELMKFKDDHLKSLADLQNATVMTEYHGKKFNLVACDIKQLKDWETQDELKAALKSFFNVCGLDNASFTITAIHRL